MESSNNGDDIISIIAETLRKNGEHLKPCKNWEVSNIEKELSINLPLSYKDFLLAMGRGAGSFMLGSSCFYQELFSLRSWALELLEENGFKNLPSNSFVFWMHQGYQFAYFLLGEGDDPPVYYYNEVNRNNSHDDFIQIEKNFTAFLYGQLENPGTINNW